MRLLCGLFLLVPLLSVAAAPVNDPDTIQVFFSRNPDSFNDFNATFAVNRNVPGPDLAYAAVQALIDGPTPAEAALGDYSDLKNLIASSVSNCKGLDFLLVSANGTATVQLCRATSSAGIGQDARAQAELNATLAQFGVSKVIVLGNTGHCLFDESGMDICLQ